MNIPLLTGATLQERCIGILKTDNEQIGGPSIEVIIDEFKFVFL